MDGSRLSLLGRFSCERHGRPLETPFGMQRLLAFLGLRGPSHRCLIAGSLWPEVPEQQALASLRTAVWRTKRLAPGLLRVEGDGMHLSSTTWVDSAALEQAVGVVLDSKPVDESVAGILCQPELLSGWYDDWVVFERERLNQLRLHALEVAAQRFIEKQRLDLALRLALEAVRTEPLRETANAVLMSVYLAEGNVSDAIHQYGMFRALLRRELDLEPSSRLAKLLPERKRTLTPT
ncbi:BTAD domain-containing putative transcriptional regulator [Kribbella sp. NPDC058693]|uniref:AfsR/SARP family transcriptional regulator n=1 Tax=Kribbella sp. NPDC058693 TaxID=3346602 RepID=UPI0036476C9C